MEWVDFRNHIVSWTTWKRNYGLLVTFLGLIAFGLLFAVWPRTVHESVVETDERDLYNDALKRRVSLIQAEEQALRTSIWKNDVAAQSFGRVLESLWDEINLEENGLAKIAAFPVNEVLLGTWSSELDTPHQIRLWRCQSNSLMLDELEWLDFVNEGIETGWRIDSIEFRHIRFDPAEMGARPKSVFYFRSGLSNSHRENRAIVEGPLRVTWNASDRSSQEPAVEKIDVTDLEVRISEGPLPFRLVLETQVVPPEHAHAIDPLLVQDLDGDGRMEIVLANRNLIFRLNERDEYRSMPFCSFPPGLISTGMFADLNGDGFPDFICHKMEGLVMLPGSRGGVFDQAEVMLWPKVDDVVYPMVISAGDFDRDGDLDVFLGQYRVPYEGGSLPTPFFDANDGYPFFLLRNDGDHRLVDVTERVGLDKKRKRRVYSASFSDIDGQNGVDLLVVSDFSGADLYLNNGSGVFLESSAQLFDESHGFGMAHTISDFNVDGALDVLMIGMTSPTVDRLNHLQLWREGLTTDRSMPLRMASGNRLFLSEAPGHALIQNSMSESISRSGWAWGCGAGDFDNDGYPDVFIGNGLESRQSVQDYESEYWLHDAYVADSEKDPAAYLYFKEKFARTRGQGHSYGGYESNRLYLNVEGESFVEIGHLWGLGIQRDTRNVVVQDVDGDGLVDIVMTNFEIWPEVKQTVRVYRNELGVSGNWIGFRFPGGEDVRSPIGTRVDISAGGRRTVDEIVTGDSFRSQHAAAIHFGLGDVATVDQVTIHRADGSSVDCYDLAANRYYLVANGEVTAITDTE